MAHIDRQLDVTLSNPTLIEGFPGVGLVGKIIADHLIESLEMEHYANVHCEGIPPVATYQRDQTDLVTPVRLYVDADRELLALQSDVPIKPKAASALADCVSGWFESEDVLPVYVSGLPRDSEAVEPTLYGVGVGEGADQLTELGVNPPSESGLVSGPTGGMLAHAIDTKTNAIGAIVESDPNFPDPIAAQTVINHIIEPIADITVETEELTAKADEIEQARTQLLKRMQQASEESSSAQPLRMYQ